MLIVRIRTSWRAFCYFRNWSFGGIVLRLFYHNLFVWQIVTMSSQPSSSSPSRVLRPCPKPQGGHQKQVTKKRKGDGDDGVPRVHPSKATDRSSSHNGAVKTSYISEDTVQDLATIQEQLQEGITSLIDANPLLVDCFLFATGQCGKMNDAVASKLFILPSSPVSLRTRAIAA